MEYFTVLLLQVCLKLYLSDLIYKLNNKDILNIHIIKNDPKHIN